MRATPVELPERLLANPLNVDISAAPNVERRGRMIIDEQEERGATSSTYQATLPDGTVAQKQSSDVHQDTAILGCWEFRAKWNAGLIYAKTTTAPLGTGLTLVEAKRLTVRADRNPTNQ